MRFGRYGLSHVLLRWGLGLTFVWVALDIFRSPDAWIGYVPPNPPLGLSPEATLQLTAVYDGIIGLLLLLNSWSKVVAILATLHLAAVVITNGVSGELVRNIGLLGMAAALAAWPQRYHRRKSRWFGIFGRKKKPEPED